RLARAKRGERAGLRQRRRLLLDLLLFPRGRAVSLGGGCRACASALAAPFASRRRRRTDVAAEGRPAGGAPGLLRQGPQGAPDARGARRLPGLLRARARSPAEIGRASCRGG